MQQQIVQLVQAAMSGDQQASQQIEQIMQAAQQGDQQAAQIAQMIQQVAQQLQGQQAQMARWGAKLNYINFLRGKCPEGYQMFKAGGRCLKCEDRAQQMATGGKQDVISEFKCGRKMKKKACGGSVEQDKCGSKIKKKVKKAEGGTNTDTFEEQKNVTAKVNGKNVKGTRQLISKTDPYSGRKYGSGLFITNTNDTIPFYNDGTSYDNYNYPEAKQDFLRRQANLKVR